MRSRTGEPGKPGEPGQPGTGGGGRGGKGGTGGRGGRAAEAIVDDRELLSYGHRIQSLETACDRLEDRFDKWTLAILGFAVTVAMFGLGLAISLFTTQGG